MFEVALVQYEGPSISQWLIPTVLIAAGMAWGIALKIRRRPALGRVLHPTSSTAHKVAVAIAGIGVLVAFLPFLLLIVDYRLPAVAVKVAIATGAAIWGVATFVVGYTVPSRRQVKEYEKKRRLRDRAKGG